MTIILFVGVGIGHITFGITLALFYMRQRKLENTMIAALLTDRVTLSSIKQTTSADRAATMAVLRRVTQINAFCEEYSWRLAHFTDEELKDMADAEYERVYGNTDTI